MKITVNNEAEPLTTECNGQAGDKALDAKMSAESTDESAKLTAVDKVERKPSVASNVTSATIGTIDTVKPRNSSFGGMATGNELTVYSSIPNTASAKPGTEVLTLISTWIKSAPNDFMDSRVLDEIKHFFSQLDSLKSSFKPWTSKLKQMLRIDEMDNYKDESNDMINNEDIINQYQFVYLFLSLHSLFKRFKII